MQGEGVPGLGQVVCHLGKDIVVLHEDGGWGFTLVEFAVAVVTYGGYSARDVQFFVVLRNSWNDLLGISPIKVNLGQLLKVFPRIHLNEEDVILVHLELSRHISVNDTLSFIQPGELVLEARLHLSFPVCIHENGAHIILILDTAIFSVQLR